MEVVTITGLTGKSGDWMLQYMLEQQDSLKDYHFKVAIRGTSNIKNFLTAQFSHEFVTGNLTDEEYKELFWYTLQGFIQSIKRPESYIDKLKMR